MNPVLMPARAYRRTWIADRLDDMCGRGLFLAFLRQLTPAQAALVANATTNQQVFALLMHLNNHYFPIDDYVAASVQMATDEGDLDWEDVLMMGIPVEVYGFEYERDADSDDAMVFCALSQDYTIRSEFVGVLEKYNVHEYAGRVGRIPKLPRGRQWIEPWGDLGLMYEWINGATQNRWLDWNTEMLEQGGNPPWEMEEIRALAKDWKRSEPQVKRLTNFRRFLQTKPEVKIPLLAGALVGDKHALQRMTRPARVKTLAEVLT